MKTVDIPVEFLILRRIKDFIMKDINGLLTSLNGYLEWNKARTECFTVMLLELFAVKVANLQELALAFQSEAQISSRYRRLQRFFANFNIDYTNSSVDI